jgi:hypothetical protein
MRAKLFCSCMSSVIHHVKILTRRLYDFNDLDYGSDGVHYLDEILPTIILLG